MNLPKISACSFLMTLLSFSLHSAEKKPASSPVQEEKSRLFLYGDFLFWQANANNIPLAAREVSPPNQITATRTVIEEGKKMNHSFPHLLKFTEN